MKQLRWLAVFAAIALWSGSALGQALNQGIQATQTAANPLQLRISDGDLSSILGTYQFKATNILLTASTTNYIYLDLSQTPPVLTVNTTGFPASQVYKIATAITNATQITSLTDNRPALNLELPGGSGGSAWQNQGSALGTPTTVNCTTNLTCTFSNGVVTIVASSTGSTSWSAITPATNTGSGFGLSPTATGTVPWTITAPSGITVDAWDFFLNTTKEGWFDSTGLFHLAQSPGFSITGNAATASSMAVGGLTGLGTGVGTFLATPTVANLGSALGSQTANCFVAAPNGSAGNLGCRAIVAADVPTPTSFSGSLAGDVSGTQGATVVGKINGTSLAGLATGILKNTTATGVPSIAGNSDVLGLWTGTCSSSTFLRGDGACATPAGSGTVTSVTVAGTANQVTVSGTCTITSSGTCTLSLPAAVVLGTDGSVAGSAQLANSAAAFHTILGSAATANNTVNFFATAPTSGDLVKCVTVTTACTLTDASILAADVVTYHTPATGIARAAGGSQALTASELSGDCTTSGSNAVTCLPLVSKDTSTPITVSTTADSAFYNNQNATAGTAVTYNLPTAAAGKQFCFTNSNGGAANTGVLTVATSASGQFIIFTDGTLSATGGNVTSGGAAADAACVVGVDSTHWQLYVQRGTWTKH